jgi:glycosyltransferase involved in cell wall biosynthesis
MDCPELALNGSGTTKTPEPLFSVIIAVYNDWPQLEQCLQSLAEQTHAPPFEVIVVDDGGSAAPEPITRWAAHYSLTVIRQTHQGISAARNRGIKGARGAVVVFVDADCKLQAGCLAALASAVNASPRQSSFQLKLVGDCSHLVGRAEALRLATLQDQLLQPNGCIHYLDTAGAAIRKTRVDVEHGLFDVRVRRGEDTLLLTDLIRDGELPLFVAGAVVQHAIRLSFTQYMLKAMRGAFVAEQAYAIIASKGVKIRVSHRKRLQMLLAMWKLSRRISTGRSAWFVTVSRQSLSRISSCLYRVMRSIRNQEIQ